MRAGRLQVRRIKVRRRFFRITVIVLLLGVLLLALWQAQKRGLITLPVSFAPSATLSPDETKMAEETLSLPGETWYALQLGVYTAADAANTEAEAFQLRGAAGYVYLDGNQYRVLAAAYQTRTAAQAVAVRLKESHQIDSYIIELARGDLSLRGRGQKAQLDALHDAYACLSSCATQLGTLSSALDDQTMSAEEVKAALLSEETTLRAVLSRLTAVFSEPPGTVAPVLEALASAGDALKSAQAADGLTALGSKVKYAQLLSLDLLFRYTNGLTAAPAAA